MKSAGIPDGAVEQKSRGDPDRPHAKVRTGAVEERHGDQNVARVRRPSTGLAGWSPSVRWGTYFVRNSGTVAGTFEVYIGEWVASPNSLFTGRSDFDGDEGVTHVFYGEDVTDRTYGPPVENGTVLNSTELAPGDDSGSVAFGSAAGSVGSVSVSGAVGSEFGSALGSGDPAPADRDCVTAGS